MPTAGEDVDAFRSTLLTLLKAVPDASQDFFAALEAFEAEADEDAWEGLVLCAGFHGVLGAIWPHLSRYERLPAPAREAALRRLAIDQLWQEHLMRGLEAAARPLAAAGIDVSVLKGPLLGARIYPSPMSRHCLDLDLLVRDRDLKRAVDVLTAAGYASEGGVSADYLRQHGHHLGFVRRGTAPVELHFRAYAGFGVILPAGVLLDRAEPFQLTETLVVLAPSPEDEYVYLATHAAGHSFIRFMWLYDLKLLLRHSGRLNWDRVGATAASLGVVSPVGFATHLLEAWLGVPVGPLPQTLSRRGPRYRVAERLLPEVSRPQPRSMWDNLGGLVFTSLLCDRVESGVWLFQHHVMRGARRRLKHLAPTYLPESWSA